MHMYEGKTKLYIKQALVNVMFMQSILVSVVCREVTCTSDGNKFGEK